MQRRTLDIIISAGGLGLVVLLLVGAFVLRTEANFSNDYVKDQLSRQKISFTAEEKLAPDDVAYTQARTGCVIEYAGQAMTTGKQAECFANEYLGSHLSRMPTAANPMTYSEIGTAQTELRTQIAAAKAANQPTADLDKQLADLTTSRETVFKGEMLRGALLSSYGFSVLGEKAMLASNVALIAAAILAVLSVAGFVHAFVTPRSQAFAAVSKTEGLAGREATEVRLQAEVAVLRMDALEPPISDFLIQPPPAEFEPGAIEKEAHPVSPGHPEHDRRGVREQAETGFARAEQLLVTCEIQFQLCNSFSQNS
jgi:hypothetical protein